MQVYGKKSQSWPPCPDHKSAPVTHSQRSPRVADEHAAALATLLLGALARREYRRERLLNIVIRCGPRTQTDAHRVTPAPGRAATPADTGRLQSGDDAPAKFIAAKVSNDLVQNDLVQDRVSGFGQSGCKATCLPAIPRNQLRP